MPKIAKGPKKKAMLSTLYGPFSPQGESMNVSAYPKLNTISPKVDSKGITLNSLTGLKSPTNQDIGDLNEPSVLGDAESMAYNRNLISNTLIGNMGYHQLSHKNNVNLLHIPPLTGRTS